PPLTPAPAPSFITAARYTPPMPPAPTSDRISYGPSRVPASDISARGRRHSTIGSAPIWGVSARDRHRDLALSNPRADRTRRDGRSLSRRGSDARAESRAQVPARPDRRRQWAQTARTRGAVGRWARPSLHLQN